MDKARAYAIKEAQKATYRDTNALSQAISDLGRYRGKGPVGKGISTVMEKERGDIRLSLPILRPLR